MKTKLLLYIAASCGATLAASAQPRIGISLRIGAPPPLIVREEPPRPVIVEYQTSAPSPGPNHVWVRSHNRWVDGHWIRVQGGWVVPPRPDATWVEGRWEPQSRSWTDEHWEINRPISYATPNGPPPPPYARNGPPPPPYAPPGPPQPPSRVDNNYYGGPSGEIFIGSAPPRLREERMSRRPSREHVWIAGYWTASRGRHEWVTGHWEVPPREHSTWIEPRWEQRDRNYLFVRGYWR